jgi:hypothetical protein
MRYDSFVTNIFDPIEIFDSLQYKVKFFFMGSQLHSPQKISNPAVQTNGVLICIFLSLFVSSQEKGELTSRSVIAARRRIALETIHWHFHQFQDHTHEFLAVIHCLHYQK